MISCFCKRGPDHEGWMVNRGIEAWRPVTSFPLLVWLTRDSDGLVNFSESARAEALFRGAVEWINEVAGLPRPLFKVDAAVLRSADPVTQREWVRVALTVATKKPATQVGFSPQVRGRIAGATIYWPVDRWDLANKGEAEIARFAAAHELLHTLGVRHAPRRSEELVMRPKLQRGNAYTISPWLAERLRRLTEPEEVKA